MGASNGQRERTDSGSRAADSQPPTMKTGPVKKPERASPKAERLRTALRENLKRRKAQAKGRLAAKATPSDGTSIPTHDSAEIGADKQSR
jgi:hypothetical protein